MTHNLITTHKSHFGIKDVIYYGENVHLVSRNKGDLIRIALIMGMQKVRTYCHILEMDGGVVITDSNNETSYMYQSEETGQTGMIAKHDQDGNWYLQVKLNHYRAHFSPRFDSC